MVEALLRARLARVDAPRDWQVSSAGVWAAEGQPASAHSVEEMAQRGLDLSAHQARSVTRQRMEAADLVLAMTRHHAEALEAAFPDHAHKVHMLSKMVGQEYDIYDPYGGPRLEYAHVARELEELVEAGFQRIITIAEENAIG
jgi:protein-tyrosine phosphatase